MVKGWIISSPWMFRWLDVLALFLFITILWSPVSNWFTKIKFWYCKLCKLKNPYRENFKIRRARVHELQRCENPKSPISPLLQILAMPWCMSDDWIIFILAALTGSHFHIDSLESQEFVMSPKCDYVNSFLEEKHFWKFIPSLCEKSGILPTIK